jgi:hypothetical protein
MKLTHQGTDKKLQKFKRFKSAEIGIKAIAATAIREYCLGNYRECIRAALIPNPFSLGRRGAGLKSLSLGRGI